MQQHLYDCDQPELHGILRDLRALMNSYPERTTVGEVMVKAPGNARIAASYLGDGTDELHMTFDFTLLNLPWDPGRMFRQIESWYGLMPEKGWPTVVFSNHDVPRSFGRYGGRHRAEKARLLALLLLTLRGSPFIYYGEEIGMEDGRVSRGQLRDPVGLRYWPLNKGRDPARTPMQWTPGKNAGFTTGAPWLPVPPLHAAVNVAGEETDPSSLLNFYKTLIRIRRENPCLSVGSWNALHRGEDGLIGFERNADGARIAVIANMSGKRKTVLYDGSIYGRVILSTHEERRASRRGTVELLPYEGVIVAPGVP
jgi:alpha-glucosidase